ncbi:MAG TPA: hypothetical protein VJM12_00950, partial [Pyrinomonadaceae bacterium]|nr:hypothetical protein [Pyrinomonadaceae bacterium]
MPDPGKTSPLANGMKKGRVARTHANGIELYQLIPRARSASQFFGIVGFLICALVGHCPTFAKKPAISFADLSASSGLTVSHVSTPEKRYIVESMSGGAALFDCDEDGYLDL